jgi:exonuclease VII small subunit
VIAVRNTRGKAARDPGARYAKLLETHEQHCAELSRAMNRWQKSRKALWAAEKRLDKLMQQAHTAQVADPFNDKL